MPDNELSVATIRQLLRQARDRHSEVQQRMRVLRALVNRDSILVGNNATGTVIPAPFNKTSLAIRTMLGEPAKAVQHYTSRIAANRPDIEVVATTAKSDITATVDKEAGKQERLDSSLWDENGGRSEQWTMGWAMSLGGVGYYLTLPRDANFGLPDRIYYEDRTDDEIAMLKREGVLSHAAPKPMPTGKLAYAESGDVWAARRRTVAKQRAVDGPSLFTLTAYPRDMVLCDSDIDGLKWIDFMEEIAGDELAPGSELAMSAARSSGVPMDDWGLYGLMKDDKGRIIGGISRGSPVGSLQNRSGTFVLHKFTNREELVFLVSTSASLEGAREVYRCDHGCTVQGVPSCPAVEVPFMRTDTHAPGQEFSTPLASVFALVPLVNQIMTLRSNAEAFNLIPRWVVELANGQVLRNEDGEPVVIESAQTPGLNPNEAAAYPGKLVQLTIDTAQSDELLKVYLEELAKAMPSGAATGASGSDAAAWQVRQLIQQAQETLRQPVDNHAAAVKRIIRMWHGWLRDLDVPVYFFPAPSHRKDKRSIRGLVEFDPKNLTDSIYVVQQLDTPEEKTVKAQQGLDLWEKGVITDEQLYSDYLDEEDARQAVIDRYVQQITNHVMGGVPAPPGSVIQIVADGVRGSIIYALINASPNFAVAQAEQIAQQAQQAQMPPSAGTGPNPAPMGSPQAGGSVAAAAGVSQPGMGMNPSLQGQLGSNVPGGNAPMAGVQA